MPELEEDPIRVLIVEDDSAVAQMYRIKLELDGYAVTIAPDGEVGLKMAADDQPDLIFLDIRLPKLDGLSLLETMRSTDSTRNIPVVILSNYSERDLVERGFSLGALEYLIKSQTTPARLSGWVDSWLKSG